MLKLSSSIGMLLLCWAVSATAAETGAQSIADKTLSGMSVLGNNEAPKSLVIVPWKSSQIGDGIGVVDSLSNRPMPVDRDVFGRELHYYQIRTQTPATTSPDNAQIVRSQ
jgi:hypothetical protein